MKLQIVVIFALATLAVVAKESCNRKLFSCFSHLANFKISNESTIIWPTDDSGVLKLCSNLEQSLECMQTHLGNSTCATNSRITEAFVEVQTVLEKYQNQTCTSVELREQFLTRTQCYTKLEVISEVKKIVHQYWMLVLQGGFRRFSCCANLYLIEEIHGVNEKFCKPEVGEYVHKMVQEILGPIYHNRCGPIKNYTQCHAALPIEHQKMFDAIVANKNFSSLHHSFSRSNNDNLQLTSSSSDTKLTAAEDPSGRNYDTKLTANGSIWGFGIGQMSEIMRIANWIWSLSSHNKFLFHMIKAIMAYCMENKCYD